MVASIPNRPDPSAAAALPASMAGMNLKLGNTEPAAEPEMSRAERKALKKAQSLRKEMEKDDGSEEDDDEEEDDLLNPLKATEKRQAQKAQAKANPTVKPPAPAATKTKPAVQEMTRKERRVPIRGGLGKRLMKCAREAADKKAAADRYAKMHAQGAFLY